MVKASRVEGIAMPRLAPPSPRTGGANVHPHGVFATEASWTMALRDSSQKRLHHFIIVLGTAAARDGFPTGYVSFQLHASRRRDAGCPKVSEPSKKAGNRTQDEREVVSSAKEDSAPLNHQAVRFVTTSRLSRGAGSAEAPALSTSPIRHGEWEQVQSIALKGNGLVVAVELCVSRVVLCGSVSVNCQKQTSCCRLVE